MTTEFCLFSTCCVCNQVDTYQVAYYDLPPFQDSSFLSVLTITDHSSARGQLQCDWNTMLPAAPPAALLLPSHSINRTNKQRRE